MNTVAENTAHVECEHAADYNWTRDTIAPNTSTANAVSNDNHDVDNIGSDEGDDIIAELRTLLGNDVVLLPIVSGFKRPTFACWPNTTVEAMGDAEYLVRLRCGSIGVVLGRNSGGLCAIDIDGDEFVEPFLALNPTLRNTLRSKGARGAQLWVRMKGEYPKLAKLKTTDGKDWGEWRCDGGQSVIYGVHHGMHYQRLVDVAPVEIGFDEIVWPENLKLPWVKSEYDLLVEKYGEAIFGKLERHPSYQRFILYGIFQWETSCALGDQ